VTEDLTPRVGDIWRFTFTDGCVTDFLVTRTDTYPDSVYYEPSGFLDLMSRKDVPHRLLYRCPEGHYRKEP
jgi:hypothetical protein